MTPRLNQPRIPLHPSDRHGRTIRRVSVALLLCVWGAALVWCVS